MDSKHSSEEYLQVLHISKIRSCLYSILYSRDIQLASTITVPEGMLVIGGWNQESGSLRENPNSGGFYKPGFTIRA